MSKNTLSALALSILLGFTGCAEKRMYTNAVVLEAKDISLQKTQTTNPGLFAGSSVPYIEKDKGYVLKFKGEDQKEYTAMIIQRGGTGPEEFMVLREAIKTGSEIEIKTSGLGRFKGGLSGVLVNDEIKLVGN